MKKYSIIAFILCLFLTGCGKEGNEYLDGYNAGYEIGHDAGYQKGISDSTEYNRGYEDAVKYSEKNDTAFYDNGYREGYSKGYDDGKLEGSIANSNEKEIVTATFSGSFTASVEYLCEDYYALPGKTIAMVHFYTYPPFLIHFDEDMEGKFEIGEAYVFDFEPFTVNVNSVSDYLDISDYMYHIHVTSYRIANEGERGVSSIMPDITFN